MKVLNSKYLVLLLMLSFGSASIHAVADHDNHGCSVCILSTSQEQQFQLDPIESDSDLALLSENDFSISISFPEFVEQNSVLSQLFHTQSTHPIRGPPNFHT